MPQIDDDNIDLDFVATKLSAQAHYNKSLVKHWLETLGLDNTISLLQKLREPYESIWIKVDTNRTDTDSVVEILEEMEVTVSKHPHFDDVILVSVEKNDFEIEEDLPAIIVDRESASSIALGKDVITSNVVATDDFKARTRVKIIDHVGNVLATAITEAASDEIKHLPLQVIARVEHSLANAPPITELSLYRQGYITPLTPIQVLGIKSMYVSKQDSILVMSVDKGDVATSIAQITNHSVPITVIAQNQSHGKAIRKQIKRVKTKAIRVLVRPFYAFLLELHDIRYSSIYIELTNSRTAIMPTFNSNLTVSRLKKLTRNQSRILNNLYKALVSKASITYVTHSIDILENEKMFNKIISKTYYESQALPQELRLMQKKGILSIREKFVDSMKRSLLEEKMSTIFLDPREINNSGGYLMKFKYDPKVSTF